MEGRWFVIVCVTVACVVQCTSSIMLESSLGERQAACAGEEVVFTCQITMTGVLQWEIEPPESNSITFLITPGPLDTSSTKQDSTGYFNAIVTNFSHHPNSLGDITSNLSVVATPESVMSEKRISCNDGVHMRVTLALKLADLPSSPQNLTHIFTRYTTSEYSVRVQWEAPSDDGGVGVSNYRVTVTTEGMVYARNEISNGTTYALSLQYNKSFMFEVAATNCKGMGNPASLNFSEVSCGQPSPPANGTIEPYSSTQVGAEIQFHCDEGHTPRKWRTSQCQENGMWTPDPALLNCVMVSCGHLSPPANGSVEVYNSTQVGAEVQYHCDVGYTPREWRTSQCQENGSWIPDPALLNCVIGDCGHPGELANGMVVFSNGTRDGSVITFQCDPGLSLVGDRVSQCRSGQWTVLPQDVLCSHCSADTNVSTSVPTRNCQQEQFSTATVAAMTGVPCIVVSLTVGALLGALLHHLITRAQSKPQSQSQTQKPVPMYENIENITSTETESAEIELKSNEAYGPVRQQQISTTPIQAYGHVQL